MLRGLLVVVLLAGCTTGCEDRRYVLLGNSNGPPEHEPVDASAIVISDGAPDALVHVEDGSESGPVTEDSSSGDAQQNRDGDAANE